MLNSPEKWLFWLAACACVVAQLAIVRAVLAGRAPGVSDRRAVRWREVAWVLTPALVLVAVLVVTWFSMNRPDTAVLPGVLG